jgi:hypothetical protein
MTDKYESDFSDGDTSSTYNGSDVSSVTILEPSSDSIILDDENVVLLTKNKNMEVILPLLDNDSSENSSKGCKYVGKPITIIASKVNYRHTIKAQHGNTINRSCPVYILHGGKAVILYPAGNSWFADR